MSSASSPPYPEGAAAVRQAWQDLLSAAAQTGFAVTEMVRPPATDEQLAAAERAIGRGLPPDLAYSPAELAAEFDEFIEARPGDPAKPLYTCADWIRSPPTGAVIRSRSTWRLSQGCGRPGHRDRLRRRPAAGDRTQRA